MNLVSKLEALRRSDMVMRLAAFLLCLSLLLGLISPKLEARAFAFAPPAVAAVAAAFLGACGLKVVVDGMDREGLQDAMYKLLKEFLDTELGGITIEEWLGSAWDMTVMLGKIFLGHGLADKLNAFARWVAGKYGAQVGENEVYELQGFTAFDGTYIELGIGPSSYTGSLFSDCTMGTNLVPLGTFLLTSDLSFSLKVELFDGDQYGVRLYENGQVVNYAGSRVFDNQPVAGCFVIFRGTLKVMFQIRSGKFGLRSGPALDSVDVASLGISAESLSIDRAPSMSYMPELEADQGLALDVGAAGTMDENAVLQGVLDDVLAGELAPTMEAVKEGTVEPPAEEVPDVENLGLPALGEALTSRFPFSIPWDIAKAIRLLAAPEKAPYFEVDFLAPLADDVGGWQGSTAIVLDFSKYAIIGQLSRWTSTIGFCLALASGTKRLIWTA